MTGDVEGCRSGAWILKRAGGGGDSGEQAVSDGPGDGPAGVLEQAVDQFAGGRLFGGNPIEVGITGIAGVVIDVDERLSVCDAVARYAQALEAGTVGGHDAIELAARVGQFEEFLRVEEGQFRGDGMFVPTNHVLAFVLQSQRQAELGADAIAIGPDVADDTDRVTFPDGLGDLQDDAGRLHASDAGRSNSSMSCKTRLPRSKESSTTKRRWGMYLRITALATSPWMRARVCCRVASPILCWSGLPRTLTKTRALRRSPAISTSLTVISPALPTGISRRMASPMARFNNSRTRSSRWEAIG